MGKYIQLFPQKNGNQLKRMEKNGNQWKRMRKLIKKFFFTSDQENSRQIVSFQTGGGKVGFPPPLQPNWLAETS